MNMSSIMTLGGAIINLTWSHYRFKPATAVLTCAAVLQCAAQQSGQNWMLIRSKDSLTCNYSPRSGVFSFQVLGNRREMEHAVN